MRHLNLNEKEKHDISIEENVLICLACRFKIFNIKCLYIDVENFSFLKFWGRGVLKITEYS